MTETGAIAFTIKGSRKYDSVVVPVPNTEMKVVNPETQSSLPARQTGEICLRGPQVRESKDCRIYLYLYLLYMLLFYGTTVVATSCPLTDRINVAHSVDAHSADAHMIGEASRLT